MTWSIFLWENSRNTETENSWFQSIAHDNQDWMTVGERKSRLSFPTIVWLLLQKHALATTGRTRCEEAQTTGTPCRHICHPLHRFDNDHVLCPRCSCGKGIAKLARGLYYLWGTIEKEAMGGAGFGTLFLHVFSYVKYLIVWMISDSYVNCSRSWLYILLFNHVP